MELWVNYNIFLLSNKMLPFVFFTEVVTKYSNFVSFPIFLNGRRLNTLQVSCYWNFVGLNIKSDSLLITPKGKTSN